MFTLNDIAAGDNANSVGGTNWEGVWVSPIITVPDPPTTTPPWVPPVSMVAAFLPLMNTVEDSPDESALPHVQVSP